MDELRKIELGLLGWARASSMEKHAHSCDYVTADGPPWCSNMIIYIAHPYTGDSDLVESVCAEHLEYANTKRYH